MKFVLYLYQIKITMTQENKTFTEFIKCIKNHDYSYMMSDDSRVWSNGTNSEKQIMFLIKSLINDDFMKPIDLLSITLNEVPQQYNDKDSEGNDLTHRVIRSWFKQYID